MKNLIVNLTMAGEVINCRIAHLHNFARATATFLMLVTLSVGQMWGTSYIPGTFKNVTSNETVMYSVFAAANATTSGKWVVNPRGGTTTSRTYTNVTGDTKGNPSGLTDNMTTSSSVEMPTIQVPSTAKYDQSGRYVMHMRLKGITGMIVHGVTGSSGRGIQIFAQEYSSSLTETTTYGTAKASQTRSGNSGSFLVAYNGFDAAKEYLVTLAGVSGDVQLYAMELIAGSSTTPYTGSIYPIGEAFNWGWTQGSAPAMTNDGEGTYTLTTYIDANKEFKFLCQNDGWTPAYMAESDNQYVTVSTATDLHYETGAADHKFKIATAGFYTITLDLTDKDNGKMTIAPAAMREVYLNLSGFTGWEDSSAKFRVWDDDAKGFVNMTTYTECGATHTYVAEVPETSKNLYFQRFKSDYSERWNEASANSFDENDMMTISGWDAGTAGVYAAPTFTVTFDANGHGTAPSAQNSIACGGKASTPTAPTASGWTFGGWYKEAGCTNAWNFGSDVVTANTTLYAKWTEEAKTDNIVWKTGAGYTGCVDNPGSATTTTTYTTSSITGADGMKRPGSVGTEFRLTITAKSGYAITEICTYGKIEENDGADYSWDGGANWTHVAKYTTEQKKVFEAPAGGAASFIIKYSCTSTSAGGIYWRNALVTVEESDAPTCNLAIGYTNGESPSVEWLEYDVTAGTTLYALNIGNVTGGTAPLKYYWYKTSTQTHDETTLWTDNINAIYSKVPTNDVAGTSYYYCKVVDANDCEAYSKYVRVTVTGGGSPEPPVGGPYPTPATVASPGAISYTADASTDFLNPERGFMSQMQWNTSGGTNHGLAAGDLNASQTLVQRIYYMDNNSYRTGALPQSFLDLVSADMAVLRANGKKAVLRFCYDETMGSGTSKSDYEDATPARWTAHLAQLKPVLAANADVIFTVQAGFLGVWGEWYYSSQGNNNGGGIPDDTQFTLIDNLLDAVPASRTIQIRYVDGLRKYLASRGNGNKNRLGFHNDAYLNGEENMGTYRWGHVSEDRAYTAAQGLIAPNGGETNNESNQATYDAWSTGAKAAADMRELHYTYLNSLYASFVINKWKAETYTDGKTYYNIMSRYMGYRFQLHSATFPDEVASGADMSVFINLHNVGYAPLYNARTAYIVLKNGAHTYEFPLSANPCSWMPDGALATINENITLTDVEAGTYNLYLWLPDQAASIKSNPKYAIRFANTSVWESATGYNNLNHQVTVTGSAPVTYTITYNKGANGTGDAIANGQKTDGVDFTLSSSTYSRVGYTQTGWSLTDGGAKVYDLGGTYTTDAALTLYPFWTENAPADECDDYYMIWKTGTTWPDGKNTGNGTAITSSDIAALSISFDNVSGSGDNGVEGASLNVGKKAGNMFTITPTEGNITAVKFLAKIQDSNCQYSTDGGTSWTTLTSNGTGSDLNYSITGINGATFKLRSTGAAGVWIRNMIVTICTGEPSCTAPTLTWTTAPANGTVGDADATILATSNSAGAITYDTEDHSVATIVAGKLHYVAAGTTNVTATVAANGEHCAKTIKQSITVTAAVVPTYTVTVNDAGAGQHDCSKALQAAAGETVDITNTCSVTGYHLTGYTSSPEVSGTLVGTTYTFTMPASDVTLTAVWEEDVVACTPIITWALPVNTGASPSATGTTTDVENITSVSGLNNAGSLAYTTGAKADLTGKIEVPSSKADAKYLYFTFNVKSGKQFVTDEIVVKMQPVTSSKSATMEIVISDNHGRSLSKTFADKASGSIHTLTWTLTEAEKTTLGALQGTGTLKLYCYGNAGTYRLGTPITICGTVEDADEPDPAIYNITYYDDDMLTVLDLEPKTYTYGVGVPSLPTPVKPGYTFNGWVLWWNDGDLHEYDKPYGILPTDFDDIQLHATWTSTVTTYAITYAANGGTGTMTAAREYEAGETVTIKTNSFTAPSGKEFNGWAVTNNSTSAAITVTDGKFTMPAAAVTITAQWRDKAAPSGCNMIFYFAKAADATAQTPAVEQNTTFFTGVPGGSGSMSGSMTIDGTPYTISGRHSNTTINVSFTIPAEKTGILYVIAGGGSGKKLQIKSGSDVIEEKDCASAPTNIEFAQLNAGTYKLVSTGGNIGLGMLAIQLCDASATCASPTIDAATASQTAVCAGDNVTLSASATKNETGSGALTYQWYKSDNTAAGAAGAEITVNPEETTSYYVLVTDEDCATPAKSGSVTVTVNAATAITTQPTANTAASVGETVSLSVVATGSHLSYQWQESADGSEWADVPVLNATAKQATLSVKMTTIGTMYYRCVVSGDCGNETSSLAIVTAGVAAPTITWSDVTTVYRGEKISVSVTTNTDAEFDASALTISAGNCTVESKTVIGKTVVAELHINTDATADAEITLTFNTAAGASYGATVNNTHTLTVSGDCPTGGASGTIYTATMTAANAASATGGTVTVNKTLNSGSTATRGGNTYYKFDTSSKLTLTPEGGFKAGDVLTIDVTSSGSNDDGVIIKNAGGTQLADLHEKLSSSKNSLLEYTFTAATDNVTLMRHSSGCYFYRAYVDRVGSLTNLEWSDTDDMIDDDVVTVSSEAENFTIAAVSNNSFGAITYSIAPAGVAAINATTGEVNPAANGTATVTATIAANGCYGEKSITYTLRVADNCVAPVISAHPASATYEVNSSASAMSVTATGSELTYQWYRNSENNNTSGTAIGGAISASYTPDVTVRGTTYYYCEVKSGKCGTLSNVATIEVTRPACALAQPKIIEVSRVGGDCWSSITLKAVEQNGDALVGGTYQWYKDGEAVSTNAQPVITEAGTYTLDYTKDECIVDASNEFVALSSNPELGQLSPFQYYHAGKTDYSDQMNGRHLFTYTSLSSADPSYTATKNAVAMAGAELAALQAALERVEGENNVDTIMLSLNDLASCGFVAGDEVVITVTPKNCSGADVVGEAKSIALHVVDSKPTLAFIVSGADGEGTKKKGSLKLNGDFLTGYNKADLKVQSARETVTSAELPLYTALKENYNVVPVNGYAPFSKWNYEPFDLVFLTDFVKTDGGSDKAAAKEKVNQLAGIVDFRPLFSTKSFMSGISNWSKLGFTAQPLAPKKTQKWMNIVCYAHPMFDDFLADGSGKVLETLPNDEGTEVVFTMLSQGGFDSSKGIQGFRLSDAGAFVNIATTHYDAVANIDYENLTCTPGSVEADDELLVASCERQTNIEARMLILSVNADAHSFLTDEGIDVIILSLNYLLMTDPIDVTDCAVTFLGTTSNDWNTARNWNTNKVPTAKNNVRIAAECHVKNGEQAFAQSVKILENCTYDSSPVNGSLVIEPTGALSITGSIGRVADNKYLDILSTHTEDVTIQSSSAGNGALIHGDETGVIQATVQMYSIANGAEGRNDDEPNWQWITTPFSDCTRAASNYYGTWMTEWSNTNHTWSPVIRNDDPVRPWYAYCHTRQTEGTLTMTGTLVPTSDQILSFDHNSGINMGTLSMVGNSWTAPIIISQFEDADFVNVEKHITLWNTGYDPEGDNTEYVYGDGDGSAEDHREQGSYVTIPIKVTPELAPGLRVIPSMQAFEVKTTAAGAKLTLNYDQLVRPASGSVNIQPMRAPSRAAEQGAEGITDRLYMVVKGSRYYDYAYVFENVACSDAYDDGWDGEKNWNSNYDIPQLFVENNAGEWTISTQESLVGTRFGFFRGEDLTYTISFRYEGSGLYLHDTKTDQYTEVRTGNTYTFQSQSFNNEHRFLLTDHNPYEVPTDIGDVSSGGQDVEKMVLDEKIYIRVNNMLFDAVGRRVR